MSQDTTSGVQCTGPDSEWCLIGNIVGEHPFGPGGEETRVGAKQFSPGTKVYVVPKWKWDGYVYLNAMVIGRPRRSRRFITVVIRSRLIESWRAQVVYSPTVLRLLREHGVSPWTQGEVEAMASHMNEHGAWW
ncbi:MAG: hypothetical protein AAGI52_11615 [Bacteroidota bacterium]